MGLTAPFGRLASSSISELSSTVWPEEALLTFAHTRSLPAPPECGQLGLGKGRGAQAGWASDDPHRAGAAAGERALWAEVASAHGQPYLLPVTAWEFTVPPFLIFLSSKEEIIVDFGGRGMQREKWSGQRVQWRVSVVVWSQVCQSSRTVPGPQG